MTETALNKMLFDSEYEKAGHPMAAVAGWSMPAHFGDPEAEYWAARKTVAFFDASFLTKIVAKGNDSMEYLNRRLSQRVIDMQPGEILHAAQLNADGRMEAEMEIIRRSHESVLIAPPAVTGPYLQQLCDKYVFSEDVQFADATNDYVAFGLLGPLAGLVSEKARKALPDCVSEPLHSRYVAGGILMLFRNEIAERAYAQILALVRENAGRQIGFLPFDTLRVEAGIPWWGIDLSIKSIPLDADLRSAIHSNKGCYPGQETIAKITNLGHPARKLVGILWESEDPPVPETALKSTDGDAGFVTSSTWSPSLGKPISLAMVKWPYRTPGLNLTAHSGELGHVVQPPFVVEQAANA